MSFLSIDFQITLISKDLLTANLIHGRAFELLVSLAILLFFKLTYRPFLLIDFQITIISKDLLTASYSLVRRVDKNVLSLN